MQLFAADRLRAFHQKRNSPAMQGKKRLSTGFDKEII